jgi:hypothetical protein
MMRILDQIEAQMLMGLWHLRYLSTEQIYRLWYGNRSFDACVKRLSRLGGDGLLARRRLPHPKWSVAWSLGTEGLQELRRLFEGEW